MSDDATFDNYHVTTVNPGGVLLFITFLVCALCFVVGCLLSFNDNPLGLQIGKDMKNTREGSNSEEKAPNTFQKKLGTKNDGDYHLQQEDENRGLLQTRRRAFQKKKRYGRITSPVPKRVITVDLNKSPTRIQQKAEAKRVKIQVKRQNTAQTSTRIGRYEEKINLEDFLFWSSDSKISVPDGRDRPITGRTIYSHKNTTTEDPSVLTEFTQDNDDGATQLEDENNLDSYEHSFMLQNEMRKLFGLAAPWTIQSILTDLTDIIYMMLISHFLGLGALVCYTVVWFILSTSQFLTDAWHSSVYKHMVATAAQETEEGYSLTGKYLRVGGILNIFLMVPISIITTYFMPTILQWIGYEGEIIDISRSFAAVASISHVINSCGHVFSSLLEIEGYARFNAIFDLWEDTIGLLLCFIFIVLFHPGLVALAVFNCFLNIASFLCYMYVTHTRKGMFENYTYGIFVPAGSKAPGIIKSITTAAIPFVYSSIAGYIKDILLAIFASYQGAAETATWILLRNLWGLVETVPECIASAATVRVEHNLSRGNVRTAKTIAMQTMAICTVLSGVFSLVLLDTRRYLAWCFSLDETLETMILEIIPYIAICQPFITAGVTADYLNEVLGKHKVSVKISTIIDMCFTLPVAAIFTYLLHYNIEGLASAICMGFAATGVINIFLFFNTDWQYAAKKILKYTEK